MIKNRSGERVTAKQKAQLVIMSLVEAGSTIREIEFDDLADGERARVIDQLKKQVARIEKMFGFEAGSYDIYR